jgi:integrase
VFTRRDRPSAWVGEACYWVPLLLLSTGARPEDVVRLTPSDFRDDLPAFGRTSLTVRRAENMTGDRKLRTGRLFSATRTFPVPKLLIDLGITDYVAWLRKRGQSELFADLKPKGPKKERFPGFEMWWEGYLRASDAFPSGCRPARAFQKTWVTQACRCGITLNAQDYILGRKLPEHSQTASGESLLGNEILKLDKLNYAFSGILKWTHV